MVQPWSLFTLFTLLLAWSQNNTVAFWGNETKLNSQRFRFSEKKKKLKRTENSSWKAGLSFLIIVKMSNFKSPRFKIWIANDRGSSNGFLMCILYFFSAVDGFLRDIARERKWCRNGDRSVNSLDYHRGFQSKCYSPSFFLFCLLCFCFFVFNLNMPVCSSPVNFACISLQFL